MKDLTYAEQRIKFYEKDLIKNCIIDKFDYKNDKNELFNLIHNKPNKLRIGNLNFDENDSLELLIFIFDTKVDYYKLTQVPSEKHEIWNNFLKLFTEFSNKLNLKEEINYSIRAEFIEEIKEFAILAQQSESV